MSSQNRSPLWPSFWHDVPEDDRAPIRDVLAELLGHGVILGSEGSGRDLFLLVRDHYSDHIADYLSPLGLDLVIDDDASLLRGNLRREAVLGRGLAQKALRLAPEPRLRLLVRNLRRGRGRLVLPVKVMWRRFAVGRCRLGDAAVVPRLREPTTHINGDSSASSGTSV